MPKRRGKKIVFSYVGPLRYPQTRTPPPPVGFQEPKAKSQWWVLVLIAGILGLTTGLTILLDDKPSESKIIADSLCFGYGYTDGARIDKKTSLVWCTKTEEKPLAGLMLIEKLPVGWELSPKEFGTIPR